MSLCRRRRVVRQRLEEAEAEYKPEPREAEAEAKSYSENKWHEANNRSRRRLRPQRRLK